MDKSNWQLVVEVYNKTYTYALKKDNFIRDCFINANIYNSIQYITVSMCVQ